MIFITEVEPPAVEPPPEPPEAEAPDTGDVKPETEFLCPAPNQPRVGDLTQKGAERVIGHEEQEKDGVKTCVVLYEDTTQVEKLLPSTNQVTTTTAIAVVAIAAAAATEKIFTTDGWANILPLLQLIIFFDLVYLVLSSILFTSVIEE